MDGEASYNQRAVKDLLLELTLPQQPSCLFAFLFLGDGLDHFIRYDLCQIPYDYTVEVKNRFKGLDLIDRVPDELWNEVRDRRQGSRPSPWKRNAEKQNGCLGRPYK